MSGGAVEPSGPLEFGILGPLEVRVGGRALRLGATKQRAVLAMLLLHANRTLSVDRLVDALWGDAPPRTATSNVHVYVYHLRRLLADAAGAEGAGRLLSRPPGYALIVHHGELDLARFDALAAAGRQALARGQAPRAAELLHQALALWRGPPLADLADLPAIQAEVAPFEERRLAVLEERIEADLAAGRHEDLTAELERLVAEHPLRERLRGQYMLALYRAGRQAEALAVYDDARRTLARELGLQPSPLLQRLQQAILAAEPSLDLELHGQVELSGTRPREAGLGLSQLPPGIEDFTGREAELARLRELLGGERRGPASDWTVVVISGRGGVGKTTLAMRIAHEVRDRFPDGQLYADLGRSGGGRADPGDVLAELLRAFGVAGAAIPERLEERVRLYRAWLAERRVLVVLDDAADEAQVRPLLPGGPGCATLLTSRARLAGLAAAHFIELGSFSQQEALTLLTRIVGAERVRAEPAAAERIVRYCGYLPLAIRIAGVRLVARPRWPLAWLADRLAEERRRLDELAVGDLAVRASVAISYRNLGPREQRALRLLGLLGLPDFSAWVAAALLDVPAADAETVLESLVDAQLLEAAGMDAAGWPRYRFHDLLGLYAKERGAAEEAPAERDAALRRALGAYLWLAERAEERLPGGIRGIARAEAKRRPIEDELAASLLADPLGWFAAERASLLAAVGRACELGLGTLAWGLAGAMSGFFELRALYDDWRRVQRLACLAARQAGDLRGEAHALRSLGDVDLEQGRAASAAGHLEAALRRFEELGDRHGEAWALRSLGIARHGQGRLQEAVAALERSLELFAALRDRQGEAYATFSLGIARHAQERLEEAVAALERSLELFAALRDRQGEAYAVRGLGRAYQAQGRLDEAAGCFDRCLVIFHELADARGEALAVLSLGDVDRGQGRPDRAADRYRQALEAFGRIGDRFGEALALHALGELHQEQGRAGEALACFERSLAIFRELGVSLWEATTLRRIGYARGGEPGIGGTDASGAGTGPPPSPPP